MKLKRIIRVLTAAALSVCCMTAGLGAGAANYREDYDINQDGDVDVLDVIALNRYLGGQYYVSSPSMMDVNQNYLIDSQDSNCIMAYVIGSTYTCYFI